MEANDGQTLLLTRLSAVLTRVGSFWLSRPYFQQIVLVLLVLLSKNAFDIELRNIQEAYLPGAQEFPKAVGYFSASFGQVIIAAGLGITTTTQWVVLHFALTVVALGVAFYLIGREDHQKRSFMILVLASATATSSLFVSAGKYDVITYLGAVILALARTHVGSVLGAFVMASGNPEQSAVAVAALLVLSFAPEFANQRARALLGSVAVAVGWVAVQVWFAASEASSSRLDLVSEYFLDSIVNVLSAPGSSVWSWLNGGWFLIGAALVLVSRTSRKWLILSLVVLPAAVSVATADGARVFGLVVLPAYLVVFANLPTAFVGARGQQPLIIGGILSGLIALPISVTGTGWFFGQLFRILA